MFVDLVQSGELVPKPDLLPPSVPMDYDWARVNQNKYYLYFDNPIVFRIGTWFNT